MLRTALQPRWLALLGLVVVVGVAFGYLGAWQLGVAQDRAARQFAKEAAAKPRVPLGQVLGPQSSFPVVADGRAVEVSGRYDPAKQVLVPGLLPHGRTGWWVVAALRTDAGAWLPAVRGWVPGPQDPAADPGGTPTGPVQVLGVLQPDEAPDDGTAPLPAGQLTSLDAAQLVNAWGGPMYNAFVLVERELVAGGATPVATSGAQPQRVPPPSPQPHGLVWRNAAYAFQWWVFAAFVLLLWWKMVRQATLDGAAQEREKVMA